MTRWWEDMDSPRAVHVCVGACVHVCGGMYLCAVMCMWGCALWRACTYTHAYARGCMCVVEEMAAGGMSDLGTSHQGLTFRVSQVQ